MKLLGQLPLLLGLLYGAAAEPCEWPSFLGELGKVSRSEVVVLAVQQFPAGSGSFLSQWGFPPEAEQEYVTWAPRNVWWSAVEPLMHTGAVVRNAPLSRTELHHSEFYNEFMRHYAEVTACTGTCIYREHGTTAAVSAARSSRKPDYGPEEETLLRALAPHLRRAFEVQRCLAQLELERAATVDVLDRLPIAVFFVGDDRRILFHNAAARRIIARGDALVLGRDGRLTTLGFSGRRELERSIGEACLTGTGRGIGPGAAFRLERSGRDPAYSVVVSPLALRAPPSLERRPAAVVLVADPRRLLPSRDLLQQLFGLTPAQASLAGLLATGESLHDAADRLQISEGTARWTLKRIFERTDTSRQSELVRLVATSVAGLVED